MWPYWVMFLIPASIALRERGHQSYAQTVAVRQRWNSAMICMAVFVALLIGFRDQVGGDWGAYERQFQDIQWMPLQEALTSSDPGYVLLNWASAQLDWGIYGVNLVCGVIFAIGLLHFCLSLPRPWLALTVAVPYVLVVVAMGYSRQAVALGFTMLGLVALKNKSPLRFVVWGIVGATFHKTAVLILPIAALAGSRNRIWSLVLAVTTTVGGYTFFLQDSFDSMYANYVGSDVQSQGAMIRLVMNAVPSVMLLVWTKRFKFTDQERSLWRWFALISLALVVALVVVSSASTAVDRMALYLLPIQLVVFSHLPGVLAHKRRANPRILVASVVAYYALVLFVWLNFANYSGYWIPYRFYPLESM